MVALSSMRTCRSGGVEAGQQAGLLWMAFASTPSTKKLPGVPGADVSHLTQNCGSSYSPVPLGESEFALIRGVLQ